MKHITSYSFLNFQVEGEVSVFLSNYRRRFQQTLPGGGGGERKGRRCVILQLMPTCCKKNKSRMSGSGQFKLYCHFVKKKRKSYYAALGHGNKNLSFSTHSWWKIGVRATLVSILAFFFLLLFQKWKKFLCEDQNRWASYFEKVRLPVIRLVLAQLCPCRVVTRGQESSWMENFNHCRQLQK